MSDIEQKQMQRLSYFYFVNFFQKLKVIECNKKFNFEAFVYFPLGNANFFTHQKNLRQYSMEKELFLIKRDF